MKITVLFFGQLTDLCDASSVEIGGVSDTKGLQEHLNKQFPNLAAAQYVLSVNRKIRQQNVILENGDEVALLPPFSGG